MKVSERQAQWMRYIALGVALVWGCVTAAMLVWPSGCSLLNWAWAAGETDYHATAVVLGLLPLLIVPIAWRWAFEGGALLLLLGACVTVECFVGHIFLPGHSTFGGVRVFVFLVGALPPLVAGGLLLLSRRMDRRER